MPSKWNLEEKYEPGELTRNSAHVDPAGGNSTRVHLFGFVASNGGADAADINVGADAADNDTTMRATFFTYKLI